MAHRPKYGVRSPRVLRKIRGRNIKADDIPIYHQWKGARRRTQLLRDDREFLHGDSFGRTPVTHQRRVKEVLSKTEEEDERRRERIGHYSELLKSNPEDAARWLQSIRDLLKTEDAVVADSLDRNRKNALLKLGVLRNEKYAARLRRAETRLLRRKARDRRARHAFYDRIFKRSVFFKTKDGKKVRVLSYGFADINPHFSRSGLRALVSVFVDGKQLFFVRYDTPSRSEQFMGAWVKNIAAPERKRLLAQDPLYGLSDPLKWVPISSFLRMNVAPEPGAEPLPFFQTSIRPIPVAEKERFREPKDMFRELFDPLLVPLNGYPSWVFEVGEKIDQAVQRKKIKLVERVDPREVEQFMKTMSIFPKLAQHDSEYKMPILPE